ncbi:GrpB family protein [Conexibacter sp. JD483]|uniref:GrpB family protein n=1 Tax=unclassified Conexibacter TaxID=2627773 RepID=UPI002728F7E0|nr:MULTISPECIES: GrpB family protein [unclassified Conexibacter]MDO8189435.1 GrpB family protein [Conexibacter sp. CPCC 205706]MDO8199167.1 GrpB family protein [Conexibacter sp. CPCC 205762]MDR9372572.1 GrpB family protein [Conexibacter sp. JD483]
MELIGGREQREIVLVPHDPAWAGRALALRRRVAAALTGIAVRVEPIGSTAVPELAAKPIVDLQASVDGLPDEGPLTPRLARLGFELRVRERDHLMYRTPAHDVHLHVWVAGSDDERRHLLFRDWLRHSRADRARYGAVKAELAERAWGDMNDYAQAKGDVIVEITARAEAWARASGWQLPDPLPDAPAL